MRSTSRLLSVHSCRVLATVFPFSVCVLPVLVVNAKLAAVTPFQARSSAASGRLVSRASLLETPYIALLPQRYTRL